VSGGETEKTPVWVHYSAQVTKGPNLAWDMLKAGDAKFLALFTSCPL
jgi:hypothetical protein